jgi:hypothetical protein
MQTTYTAANNPGIEPAIMATCKLIHAEASEVLYSSYTLDFDTHVEAIGAFLADLTPLAKGFVRSVSLVKRATPYDREFDRCKWGTATSALCHLPPFANFTSVWWLESQALAAGMAYLYGRRKTSMQWSSGGSGLALSGWRSLVG